jgi:hypothetical protein
MKVFVLGYPGSIGGASTELWNVLKLWRGAGFDVGLIPTWSASRDWRRRCNRIGATTHDVRSASNLGEVPRLAGAAVVSFAMISFSRALKR